jgi:hypothetical protein
MFWGVTAGAETASRASLFFIEIPFHGRLGSLALKYQPPSFKTGFKTTKKQPNIGLLRWISLLLLSGGQFSI